MRITDSRSAFAADPRAGGALARPAMIEPATAAESGLAALLAGAARIRQTVEREGYAFIRGFDLRAAAEFRQLMEALGFRLDNHYLGGASPRSQLSEAIWTSTQVPDPLIIAYHTEMCYLRHRPAYLAFFCITAPERYGETVLFDAAGSFASLSPQLREKLAATGIRYQRYFPHKRSFGMPNFYVPWRDAFGAADAAEAERRLAEQKLEWRWLDHGLVTWQALPGVISRPRDGAPCLSVTMYDDHSFNHNLKRFRDRYGFATYHALQWFGRRQAKNDVRFLNTLWGDGSKFSEEESAAIQEAAWGNAAFIRWQPGDVVIFDNVAIAHGRMNVRKPRAIAAALADLYTIEDALPAAAGRAAA